MKVLVIGANGYIGSAVCEALRRNGHTVYGLIRKQEYALELIQREIIPVVGSLSDEKLLATTVEKVGIVIDTVPGTSDVSDAYKDNRALLKHLAAVYKTHGLKKRFIWTSGILTYGDHPGKIIDESVVPTGMMTTRFNFEKDVISCPDVDGVVLRPGWVYGGTGGHYIANWYGVNEKGEIDVYGNPDKSWGWVHIYDLADAFVKVAEANRGAVTGEIFDVDDDTRITVGKAREAMARAAGVKDTVKVSYHKKGDDFFSNIMEVTAVCSSDKIKRAVGWNPKCGPFLDNIQLYAASAKASAEMKVLLQGGKK